MDAFEDVLIVLKEDFQIGKITAQTDDASVFLVVPHDSYRVVATGAGPAIGDVSSRVNVDPSTDEVRVGKAVFLGIVHHPIPPTYPSVRPSRWQEAKRLIRQAARHIDPALAGFPEWKRIYADDPYFSDDGIAAGLHWARFQITSYKRELRRVTSKARAPHNFRQSQRRQLLERADHQCQRCRSREHLELDHIIPVTHGGTNDDENALVLCKACHLEKTQAERKILGLSGFWIEHHEPPERHAATTRLTASPTVFLEELERQAGFVMAAVKEE